MNTAMNIPQKVENFLSRWATISFSSTLLHVVNYLCRPTESNDWLSC